MQKHEEERDFDHVFEGEKRVMALDFLIRYPDYLADDLLDLYELERDISLLDAVETIFIEEQPDVRVVRMIRWSYGAFDNLETAVAILEARGLVRAVKVIAGSVVRHDFLVGEKSRRFLADAVAEFPVLEWYERQVSLALRVWQIRSGYALKKAQYGHLEYRNTPYGAVIPSIKESVLRRFLSLKDRAE